MKKQITITFKANNSNHILIPLRKVSLFFFIMAAPFLIHTQTSWTGNTDTDWATASNWTAGVPDASDNVYILDVSGGSMNNPVIMSGTNAFAKSVIVYPSGHLTLQNGSCLLIDDSDNNGISNYGAIDNFGKITIGANKKIVNHGISNLGTFNNNAGGDIQIEEMGRRGIENANGTFTNEAKITIAANKKTLGLGIYNYATFNNNAGGDIQIEETGFGGIWNNSGIFTNAAIITVGVNKKTTQRAIFNLGTFNNIPGAEIQIEETGGGIFNSHGTFINAAKITIGTNKKTDFSGISNYATFYNNAGGDIQIEETAQRGIENANGTFTNEAKITIGANKKIAWDGIINTANGTFNNNAGGDIQIEETGFDGIWNNSGIFKNAAKITIGVNKQPLGNGIYNQANLSNQSCAKIYLFDNLNNTGTITNDGLFHLNTAQVHTPGNFTNNGIIEDIQSTFPFGSAGFLNNDLIIQSVSELECQGVVNDVLSVGNMNSFSSSPHWYTDINLTSIAGKYDSATNDFEPTTIGVGTHTLFMELTDNVNLCVRTIPIIMTILEDTEAPSFTAGCQSYPVPFQSSPGQCETAINFAVPATADNCGVTQLKAKILDGNGNTYQSWTNNPDGQFPPDNYQIKWRAKDANGNKKVCTKSFSVLDLELPLVQCQDITVNLSGGSASISTADIHISNSDNCGIANLALDLYSLDCSHQGENTVTLIATDVNGNIKTCNSTVTVPGATVSIDDVSKIEGTGAGYTFYFFKATRTGDTDNCMISVDYSTSDGTATLFDNDYIEASGIHYWPAGGSNVRFTIVRAVKDANYESDEYFYVDLTNPTNGAVITDTQGKGTIVNDDATPLLANETPNSKIATSEMKGFHLSSNEQAERNDFYVFVYPNPASDYIYVLTEDSFESGHVSLMDATGRKVIQKEITPGQTELQVSHLAKGLYSLITTVNGQVKSTKLVLQ